MLKYVLTIGLFAAASLPVQAATYFEVEAARANARAGGPVSERDAELLDRYGCLSGTRNAFCEARDRRYQASDRRYRKQRRD